MKVSKIGQEAKSSDLAMCLFINDPNSRSDHTGLIPLL